MATSSPAKQWHSGPTPVGSDDLVRFSRGVNVEAGVHTDPGRDDFCGHPMACARVVIPGTAAAIFDPSVGIDVRRIVHAGIELKFGAPIQSTDKLSVESTLLGVDEKPSGKLVRISFAVSREDGCGIVSGETRYFSRGKGRSEGSSKEVASSSGEGEGRENAAREVTIPTDPNQSRMYAEGSGDTFPIHTDDHFARSVGLPGVIMHGMCSLSLCLEPILAQLAEGETARLASVKCRFGAIALPGQDLTLRFTPSASGPVSFGATDPEGKPVIAEGELRLR